MIDNILITNDPRDTICENTKYSLVRNDAMYALPRVIMSVDPGKRNNHAVCASRSGPQVLEYHKGTSGGNFCQANTILMIAISEQRIAPRVANDTMVFVERLFHPSRICCMRCRKLVLNGAISIRIIFLSVREAHIQWNMFRFCEQ